MNAPSLRVISSMATRTLLADLVVLYRATSGEEVAVESIGGVDAAKRVEAGEPVDVVVLAADVIERLGQAGRIVAETRVDLVRSGIAVAIPAHVATFDIGSEHALRQAVLNARSVGYSTGPSGVYVLKLFDRWGIAGQVRERIVQAEPGVPVGALIAQGKVELGFQQLSELMHLEGITVLGPLPDAVQLLTTFTAARSTGSTRIAEVERFLRFIASPATEQAKRDNGMLPA
ncbi:molybdenum ABC transporter substrate-binding protein [Paraburkholderia acidicola]|uniref:Molybdenum ABC transporter substrate-binding protein n=1 Tax=Paraburkholderia acidicola TaxID=1912599 RepID=A0A2A4EX42_9BURK|nr:substrate-binding domain-containing protein [Paraburkholderia acidicola]PCE25267.1 molybdenum ABC transporter substrate-binding protein [Paraburkholderia acidicola]